MEATLPPTSQDISYLPKGKVADTNVPRQALRGTKAAVNRRSADAPPAPLPGASSSPWVLEQILCLQQQQIQLAEQIHVHVNLWASHALHSSGVAGADSLKTLGGHVSQQASAAVPLLSRKAGSLGLPPGHLETSQATSHQHPFRCQLCVPGADVLRPEARWDPGAPQRPVAPLAGVATSGPRLCARPEPLLRYGIRPIQERERKPPSVSPVHVKPKDKVLYKHKCKYCSKVWGTDSSLQIHLRSHTGERPFVCSVCSNRFTTKGNLKVHFHQHLQVKANPQLFAEFHDKMTAGCGLPYALSGPVSVDESLSGEPVLATGTPNVVLP